jgi:hypothetical protein
VPPRTWVAPLARRAPPGKDSQAPQSPRAATGCLRLPRPRRTGGPLPGLTHVGCTTEARWDLKARPRRRCRGQRRREAHSELR